MGRVIHFEILADDLDRAIEFYRKVFGWKIHKGEEQYAVVTTGNTEPGINGGIMPRMSVFENKGEGFRAYVCTIDVENLDDVVAKIKEAGGQQVTDKKEIPHVGTHAYFKDTEGNVLGVIQSGK